MRKEEMDDYYECPILKMDKTGREKVDICLGCPSVRLCYEEIPSRSGKPKLPMFLKAIQGNIKELVDIENYIKELMEEKNEDNNC